MAGKTLSVAALGLAGFVTVWAVTALGFGAGWGNPAAVVLVIVATVFAVGGVSILVASLARTEQQADAYTGAVTFVLALLGGNFVGPSRCPTSCGRSLLPRRTAGRSPPSPTSARTHGRRHGRDGGRRAVRLGIVTGAVGLLVATGGRG